LIAWKFLRAGAIGPFSRFAWPTPADGEPGEWVDSAGAPAECVAGIHACAVDHLPIWIDAELWVVELADPVERARSKLVAPRGRLVSRVEGWDEATARAFAGACAARAGEHAPAAQDGAEGRALAEDAAEEARDGNVATAAYIAAHAAAHAVGWAGIHEERAWQARWLADRLNL
jgi:hypothetical protein